MTSFTNALDSLKLEIDICWFFFLIHGNALHLYIWNVPTDNSEVSTDQNNEPRSVKTNFWRLHFHILDINKP